MGGGLHASDGVRAAGATAVLSRWVAALRGDRSARGRGERDRQPDLRAGGLRFLPRGAVVRLHERPRGEVQNRRRRRRHRRRGARARLLSISAVSPRPGAPAAGVGAYRQCRAARARQREVRGSDLDPGSPRIEEAVYWLNLLVDTTLPICGNASQRPHGQLSNDGDKNIVDSVDYIVSRVWADESGRNRAGVVLVQDQQVFASRDVQKADARPGGYVATGGHGGILGAAGWEGPAVLNYLPATRHTYLSAVNLTRLPAAVMGHVAGGETRVSIKDGRGDVLESAIPKVTIVKDGNYTVDDYDDDVSREVDLLAQIERNLAAHPLAGFVVEGLSPYGRLTSAVRTRVMRRAAFSGMPVVLTGRGNAEGFVPPPPAPFIGGRNLTSTKARLLLMACLMKLGSLPAATDPDRPTAGEVEAVQKMIREYHDVFDTH